ncbi:MAG: glycosyltransferase family 39 protein [Candidatus Omnitrophica bacterium]|nr:glycosyltransferase family 39 protein [Candidatus Omnitrophota bacterium]
MRIVRDLWLSFVIVLLLGIVLSLSLPYLAIDETRYLTAAWEMKESGSFMVPLLNGLPYPHKPPLLFWLINLDWLIFGVNEKTLRFIPLLFSLLNLVMVYIIALRLWQDKKTAVYAALILSSTLIYLLWSGLIVFDIIFTFWVLLGIIGLLSARTNKRIAWWLLVGIAIGGGLLTKGPVIFAHLLPVGMLYFLWRPDDGPNMKKWYAGIVLAVFTGAFMALLWALPAAAMGGEAYKKAILWGQTANRIVSSFAHQRPVWWYAFVFPLLFFPWILIKPTWVGYSVARTDAAVRFLLAWILSSLLLFSLVSGKQIYYLIPLLPALSLLVAKNAVMHCTATQGKIRWHYPVALCYIVLALIMLLALVIRPSDELGGFSVRAISVSAICLIVLGGGMLRIKPACGDVAIKTIATSSILAVMMLMLPARGTLFSRYDIRNMARVLKEKQNAGYAIIHYDKYHGQYQFLGRLTRPLIILEDKKSIGDYAGTHNKVLLITYEKKKKTPDENDVVYQQWYRGKKVVLWNEGGIRHFVRAPDPAG